MSTSTPLGDIDPNRVSSTNDSASPASATLSPLSKDKSALREWTFPRSGITPPSTVLSSSTAPSAIDHGRSSSTAHSPASDRPRERKGSSATSKDLRHRINASVFSAHTPAVSVSSSSRPLLGGLGLGGTGGGGTPKPTEVVKLVYSNVRRRSFGDILWLIVFGGSLIIFTSALMGFGSAQAVKSLAAQSRIEVKSEVPIVVSAVGQKAVEVEIPEAYLASPAETKAPADVHQPHGDSSHDQGEELMVDSPEDPSLDDENAHDHPTTAPDALFSDDHPSSPHDADDHDHASSEDDSEGHHGVSHLHDEDEEEEEVAEEELEDTSHIVEEDAEEEAEDPHAGEHGEDVEPTSDADDEGELTMPAEDEEDDEETELLSVDDVPPGEGNPDDVPPDVDGAEEEEHGVENSGDAHRRPAGREGFEAIKKDREALGRVGVDGGAGAGGGGEARRRARGGGPKRLS